jgi:uncharacterized protein YprB with RNaseH-like and TPR domain
MLSRELMARLSGLDCAGPGAAMVLEPSLSADKEADTPFGPCWRIDRSVADLWPEQERWLAALARQTESREQPPTAHGEISALRSALPERVLVLDLETVDDAIQLVGLLHAGDGVPVITQLVARDASEEPAVLAALAHFQRDRDVLVTHSGKAVDCPLLLRRMAQHGLDFCESIFPAVHCDLLHHARRRWKSRLPDCKLQTLERYVCGRRRGRTLGETGLSNVLESNALDLITLWQLALWLAHA